MFDNVGRAPQPLRAADVRRAAGRLTALEAGDDAELVDQIAALELLKRAAAGAQARVTAAFAASRAAAEQAAGVPVARRGRGVAEEVALARRESPHRGGRHLGLAVALTSEMPSTLAALTAGAIDEWAATVLVRESAILTREQRGQLDARIGPLLTAAGIGVARLGRAAAGIAADLDPAAVAARASKAAADRRVSIRPAPDTMTWLTALLPVVDGVAVYAALDAAARTATAAGDPRGRRQVMADALLQRCTGRATDQPVPLSVSLVMTDETLLDGDPAPATVTAPGTVPCPVPAPVARALVAAAAEVDAAWVRRLFTAPATGALVALESTQRRFPAGLALLITLRDQTCATPWCDAPIRHIDHITAATDGGPTTAENGQGLCEHCNLIKTSTRLVHHRDRREHHHHHPHRPHLPRHVTAGPDPPASPGRRPPRRRDRRAHRACCQRGRTGRPPPHRPALRRLMRPGEKFDRSRARMSAPGRRRLNDASRRLGRRGRSDPMSRPYRGRCREATGSRQMQEGKQMHRRASPAACSAACAW